MSMCRESRIPVVVFRLTDPGAMRRVVCGGAEGTLIRAE
jgi:uridylate kinase